ncbi:hypothetical protein FK216_06500 [Moraxellaceae bacterium AER2_44_116]|nr:hypothetical protein [Moraxellaceae bacterium]TQC98503.1 hypothetical protein FK216_06500 [Moraxellaceae bacterium AER2_44_116]
MWLTLRLRSGYVSRWLSGVEARFWVIEFRFFNIYDLRGYRLFVHVLAALGNFMFAKRANRSAMRKS